jgi:hypothetical protein
VESSLCSGTKSVNSRGLARFARSRARGSKKVSRGCARSATHPGGIKRDACISNRGRSDAQALGAGGQPN